MSTDASATAIGAILSQVHNGNERVLAYWSRQLQKSERNYSTIECEALSIASTIKEFYLYFIHICMVFLSLLLLITTPSLR